MAEQKYKIPFLSVFGLLIGIAIVLLFNPPPHQNVDNKQVQDSLHTKELAYEHLLKISEKQRDSIRLRYDSLVALHLDHIRQDSIDDAKLKIIPGKFKNLTSEQLQAQMMLEYNKNH